MRTRRFASSSYTAASAYIITFMSETVYFLMIGLVIAAFLMLFTPIRVFVLALFKVNSIWGALWSIVATVVISHWVVARNFLPRNFVLPTLDDRKTTNAED